MPIEAETDAMPADDGVWVYNDEHLGPAGPELLQQDLEQSIRRTQTGSRPFPLEHSKLLAKAASTWRAVSARLRTNTRTTVRKARRNRARINPCNTS
jgi:hypothetical protein